MRSKIRIGVIGTSGWAGALHPPNLPKHRRIVLLVAAAVMLVSLDACGAKQPEPLSGAAGIGDPYYPSAGNGGYDVQRYILTLDVDPPANTVIGEALIQAQALERLKSFDLDLHGLSVDSVVVDNSPASFARQDDELIITPKRPLDAATPFVVDVHYGGQPVVVASVAATQDGGSVGWFHSEDGTINVWSEPNGASTWYPVNDHPRDKATYRFEITVPRPWVVAATGTLKETTEQGERTRFVFEMDRPMASYLAAVHVGRYVVDSSIGPGGVRIRNYLPVDGAEEIKERLSVTADMLSFYDQLFGAYPFAEYGVLLLGSTFPFCKAPGSAEETQTLTEICPERIRDEDALAHELAHHWFGDSVSLVNWQDLWLKEGFATYAEWLWHTRAGGPAELRRLVDDEKHRALTMSVGQPPAENLYNSEQYAGGALAIHGLRLRVGDDAFFRLVRTYLQRHRDGNASVQDFVAVAEEVSGQELSAFFDSWLNHRDQPDFPDRQP